MKDLTEDFRRRMVESGQPYEDLEKAKRRWNTEQLQREFIVNYFLAPFVCVTRKRDGAVGLMEFTHYPRWYFNFMPNKTGEDK